MIFSDDRARCPAFSSCPCQHSDLSVVVAVFVNEAVLALNLGNTRAVIFPPGFWRRIWMGGEAKVSSAILGGHLGRLSAPPYVPEPRKEKKKEEIKPIAVEGRAHPRAVKGNGGRAPSWAVGFSGCHSCNVSVNPVERPKPGPKASPSETATVPIVAQV